MQKSIKYMVVIGIVAFVLGVILFVYTLEYSVFCIVR